MIEENVTDMKWTLEDIVVQLESCDFECEAGPLENNLAFIAFKKYVEKHSDVIANA